MLKIRAWHYKMPPLISRVAVIQVECEIDSYWYMTQLELVSLVFL